MVSLKLVLTTLMYPILKPMSSIKTPIRIKHQFQKSHLHNYHDSITSADMVNVISNIV